MCLGRGLTCDFSLCDVDYMLTNAVPGERPGCETSEHSSPRLLQQGFSINCLASLQSVKYLFSLIKPQGVVKGGFGPSSKQLHKSVDSMKLWCDNLQLRYWENNLYNNVLKNRRSINFYPYWNYILNAIPAELSNFVAVSHGDVCDDGVRVSGENHREDQVLEAASRALASFVD